MKKRKDLKLGVVMPVVNNLKYTKQAMDSFSCSLDHLWVIIDNGSTDGTKWYFVKDVIVDAARPKKNVDGVFTPVDGFHVVYIRHEENQGVPKSWNEGIRTALENGCDLVLVINNDTVFAEDTADNLIDWWTGEKIITVTNVGNHPKYLASYGRKHQLAHVPTFIGFLIDEGVIRRVGWFDEEYKIGYFEDQDYKERCRAEGISVAAALDAPVAHYGSRAIIEGGVKHEPAFTKNRQRFVAKHGFTPGHFPRERKRLLWVGDAGGCQTGFGRVTENILQHLKSVFDVHVLGLNYSGDPHPFDYSIYPAAAGGDWLGMRRYKKIVESVKPDAVVVVNDFYNVVDYIQQHEPFFGKVPMIAYMPVDGENVRYDWVCNADPKKPSLSKLDLAIFYTEFGKLEFEKSGYTGRSDVIPHGVDLSMYRPMDKMEARQSLGLAQLGEDAFVIGNVNNDQPRKRQDLTAEYFCRWVKEYGIPDNVYIFFHCKSEGIGYDIQQLFQFWSREMYGDDRIGKDRLITTGEDIMASRGMREEGMRCVYNALDLQVTTTMGEGWGLTQMEGMACGIPQIAPDFSALGEWGKDSMILVPISYRSTTPGNINSVGGVVGYDDFSTYLNWAYGDGHSIRGRYRDTGLKCVRDPKYRWESIAQKFADAIDQTIKRVEDGTPVPVEVAEPAKALA